MTRRALFTVSRLKRHPMTRRALLRRPWAAMQAAHGFVAHHPWAPSVGVVLNLEATGTAGPDVMFREGGAWPAQAYMRAGAYTRPLFIST